MEPPKAGGIGDSYTTFSIITFFRQAGISEKEAEKYAQAAVRENINSEELALQLDAGDLEALGLVLGDRKRTLNYVKLRKGNSSSSLPVEVGSPSRTNDVPTIMEADVKFDRRAPIGSGHFGMVFRGRYKEGEVAIKILLDVETEDFWKEARALHAISKQSHPNVLRFFGVCDLGGSQLALVTEFMILGSLKTYLNRNASLMTPALLYHFARSASAGMLHLSSMTPPVLHRDLAARNLLLGETDFEGRPLVRVADFGLARASTDGVYISAVRRKLPERCTAPEVWSRKGEHTIAADVYAFGVTLWEIFALGLDPIWENESLPIEQRRLLLAPHITATSLPVQRSIPGPAHSLLLECCDPQPERRPHWIDIARRLEEMEQAARKAAQAAPKPENRASMVTTLGNAQPNKQGTYIETSPASEAYVPRINSPLGSDPSSPSSARSRNNSSPLGGFSSGPYALPSNFQDPSPYAARAAVPPQPVAAPTIVTTPSGYGLPLYSPPVMQGSPSAQSHYTLKPADEAWMWGKEACEPQPTVPLNASSRYSNGQSNGNAAQRPGLATHPAAQVMASHTDQMAAHYASASELHNGLAMQAMQASFGNMSLMGPPPGFPMPPPFAPPPTSASYSAPLRSVPTYTSQPLLYSQQQPHRPASMSLSNSAPHVRTPQQRSQPPVLELEKEEPTVLVPPGWSELPVGVLRTYTTNCPTNLYIASTTASRILAGLPKGAQVTETLQCSLLPTNEVWRHVRYGSILGRVQTAVLTLAIAMPRPPVAVFASPLANRLIHVEQRSLITIGTCSAQNCKRDFDITYFLDKKTFSPPKCEFCSAVFSQPPTRVIEAIHALGVAAAHSAEAAAPKRLFSQHPVHELTWMRGYPSGAFKCNMCKLQKDEKSWHCSVDNFDMCASCRGSAAMPLCPSDHPCQWTEDMECGCDVCTKSLGKTAHWMCHYCNWCCCDSHVP